MQILSQNVMMFKKICIFTKVLQFAQWSKVLFLHQNSCWGSESYQILVWKKSELFINMRKCTIVLLFLFWQIESSSLLCFFGEILILLNMYLLLCNSLYRSVMWNSSFYKCYLFWLWTVPCCLFMCSFLVRILSQITVVLSFCSTALWTDDLHIE
jgi:hypothetical protein